MEDGLWRDEDYSALRQFSAYPFPVGGVMFLGNDFGTLTSFRKLKLHENPPTWRWLRQRLRLAAIPGHLGFFTNAYLGLRNDRLALAQPMNHPQYSDVCAEYLAFQIRIQTPRLIVVLGARPACLLERTVSLPKLHKGRAERARFDQRLVTAMLVSHPYSDLRKSEAQRQLEGDLLKEVWREL